MIKKMPLGTLINVGTVILGSLLGLFLKQFFTDGMESIIFQALGLGTILIGLKMALRLPDGCMLICIFSLLLGGIFGELIHLDQVILSISQWLKTITGSSDSNFSEGLITAFLLFCIGSMTIVGSIEEGLNQNRELLVVKSTLDGFSSIALAATMGIGVLFSAIPLLLFQGGLTLSAKKLKSVFDQITIDMISAVGGILILGISVNLLKIGNINLENLLPSLVFAVLLSKLNQRYTKRKLND